MSNLNDSILINPSDEHVKALLSKLAYEDLFIGFNFSSLDNSFSIAEKNYLNENFEVLSVSDSNESGFQGCFLKNTKTNEIIFAIRGTDNYEDIDDDLDIDLRGMATKQFIDAYNYFIKSTTPVGSSAYLIEYTDDKPESGAYIDEGGIIGGYYYLKKYTGTETNIDPSKITITGHSLGGHLGGLIGMVTGYQTTIFNAPSFKEKLEISISWSYVSANGNTEYLGTSSEFVGLINKLFNISTSQQNNVKHIYNDNGWEATADYGIGWKHSTPIYCLQENDSVHAINEICTAYYAYETIKDIANGAESFHNDSTITSFNETFENVYKAYCLNVGESYQELDYSDYANINQIISKINEWSETQKTNGGAIKVDSFNHSTSSVSGTNGADIIYTGGGDDTINAGNGNDIVYGINLKDLSIIEINPDSDCKKNINLGSGNDTYYGSEAKDIVTTTGTNTENDTNHIYLGAGSDKFDGGDGADIVDGGSGNSSGLIGILPQNMTDKKEDINTIHLGGGDDDLKGGERLAA